MKDNLLSRERIKALWCSTGVVTTVITMSLLGVMLLVLLAMFTQNSLRLRATNNIVDSSALEDTMSQGESNFHPDRQTLSKLNARMEFLIDSLHLERLVRGYFAVEDLRPSDFREGVAPLAQFDVLLDCGCGPHGMYDVLTAHIDPSTLQTSRLELRRRVMKAQYRPIEISERR